MVLVYLITSFIKWPHLFSNHFYFNNHSDLLSEVEWFNEKPRSHTFLSSPIFHFYTKSLWMSFLHSVKIFLFSIPCWCHCHCLDHEDTYGWREQCSNLDLTMTALLPATYVYPYIYNSLGPFNLNEQWWRHRGKWEALFFN